LQRRVMGLSQRMAESKAGIEGPWRFHLLGDGEVKGHRDGGDSLLLNYPLDQSHGLIAEPSDRGEEHGVHPVRFQESGHSRGRGSDEHLEMLPQDVAHEAEEPGSDGADGSLPGELAQRVHGKDEVRICEGVSLGEVIMRDGELADPDA